MANTFSATANSNSTIAYAQYGSSTWNKGSSNGASQGAYQGTTAAKSRVGIMVFSGAGATLSGKVIKQIVFSITCSAAGSGSSSKVLTFHKSNSQVVPSSGTGSTIVGDTLGTLTGKFYNNTASHTLNTSTNAAFFNALAAYLKEGNSALVLYNGETSSSSGYSTNYARITSITITVTYESATVWYNNNGMWVQCAVFYRLNGAWVQVAPYYNSGGTWIQV